MKIFTGIIGLIFFTLCVTFAVVNRDPATVNLWPFDTKVEAPQCLLTLGSMLFGTLTGAGLVWLNHLPHRFMSRRLKRDLALLQAKLEQLQNSVRTHHHAAPDPRLSMLTRPPRLRWNFLHKPEP